MTDAEITPGRRMGSFEVVGLDATGKRVEVRCACGSVHVIGAEALLGGLVSCPSLNAIGHDPRR